MIKINHIAIWVDDLEKMKQFYETYFGAQSGDKYINAKKGFSSYFLTFTDGARIELMKSSKMDNAISKENLQFGFAHIAISTGSKENVDGLTEKLRKDGFKIAGEARTTGDGYYESVISDPEGNLLEITI